MQCIGVVLRAQEGSAWRQGSPALTLLQKLLALSIDSRPKIRQVWNYEQLANACELTTTHVQAAQASLVTVHSRPSALPSAVIHATQNFCAQVPFQASGPWRCHPDLMQPG